MVEVLKFRYAQVIRSLSLELVILHIANISFEDILLDTRFFHSFNVDCEKSELQVFSNAQIVLAKCMKIRLSSSTLK